MHTPALHLTPYLPQHHAALRALLARPDRLHLHLDWRDVLTWLADSETVAVLGWRGDELAGALAASAARGGTSWLRLILLGGGGSVGPTVRALWAGFAPGLARAGVQRLAALLTYTWPERVLDDLGFEYVEDVVTMARHSDPGDFLPPPRNDLLLRPVGPGDLAAVVAVDHAAFGPLWQMEPGSLELAHAMAASFVLAEDGGLPVGYALWMRHAQGAHLVRLATIPPMQGQGVGSLLLHHTLRDFQQQGVRLMTVNTQESNTASQRLYRRYGFEFNGYDLPVWEIKLKPDSNT